MCCGQRFHRREHAIPHLVINFQKIKQTATTTLVNWLAQEYPTIARAPQYFILGFTLALQ